MSVTPKIVDVERIVVCVPFTPRCQEWNAREIWQRQITEIVRVTTDVPDMVGYGETLLHYTWGPVSDAAIERVQGRSPAEFLGDDSLGAGLQMALYDLVGKALDVPVYRLLNTPRVREWCPISWWNIDMSPEAFAAEAVDAVASGYTSHKIKARPWWDIETQVRAIGEVTPPHFRLDIDWNQTLIHAGNAAPLLARLDEYERVSIYESPIGQRDVDGLRHLRHKTTRPIALHFGDPSFRVTVREEVCDGFVIGGGVSRVLQQGTLAAAFDKPFWLQMVGTGLTTALALHLGAVLPLAQWPAVTCLNNYSDDLTIEPFEIVGGYARVPEGPGLGVQVDEAALARYQMDPPYELPAPRFLVSVVWPGGRVRYYASTRRVREDALAGNIPACERGVTMRVRPDDGSRDWAELYTRAQRAPVQERLGSVEK
jgi:L-alanine-DL-glutamate epimerase-like enolase superfamily enzyme